MKLIRIKLRVCLLAAIFLVHGTAFTGCAGRETQVFMEELQEAKAEVEAEYEQAAPEAEGDSLEEPEKPREIYVDVCGAVANPGVYVLEEGSRVFMAIDAAGGCLAEAAEGYVNRAEVLADGQMLYVPTIEEVEERELPVFSDGVFSGTSASDGAGDGKVNLNTADEEALTTLTGIGASRAKAIIAYREENGPFGAIEDIMNVQGIKEGTFTKIKDDIVVG